MRNQLSGDLAGQFRVELQPHLREFDADIRIQAAALDFVQQLMVDRRRAPRLIRGSDAFTQTVQGCRNSGGIEGFGCVQHVVDLHPGDEARRHPAPERGRLRKTAQGRISR